MSEQDHGATPSSQPLRKGVPPVSKAKGIAPVSKAKFSHASVRPSSTLLASSANTTSQPISKASQSAVTAVPKSSLQVGNASSSRALPSRGGAVEEKRETQRLLTPSPSQATAAETAKSDADLLDDFDDDPLMAAAIAAQKSGGVKRLTSSSVQPPLKDARIGDKEAFAKAPQSEPENAPPQSRFMAVVAKAHKRLASELKQDSSTPAKLPRPSTNRRTAQEDLPKAASTSSVSAKPLATPEVEKAAVPVAKATPVGNGSSSAVDTNAAAKKTKSDVSEVAPWQKLRTSRRSVAALESSTPCLNVQALTEEVSAKLMTLGKWKTDERTQKKLARLTEHIVNEIDVREASEAERRSLAVLKQLTGVLGSERAQEFGVWLTERLKHLRSDARGGAQLDANLNRPEIVTETTPTTADSGSAQLKQDAPDIEAPIESTGRMIDKPIEQDRTEDPQSPQETASRKETEYWQDEHGTWHPTAWQEEWREDDDKHQANTSDMASTETKQRPSVEVPIWDDWDTPWEETTTSAPEESSEVLQKSEESAAPPGGNSTTSTSEVGNTTVEEKAEIVASAEDLSAATATPAPVFMKATSKAQAPSREEWRPAPKLTAAPKQRAAPLIPLGEVGDKKGDAYETSDAQEVHAGSKGLVKGEWSSAKGKHQAPEVAEATKQSNEGDWDPHSEESERINQKGEHQVSELLKTEDVAATVSSEHEWSGSKDKDQWQGWPEAKVDKPMGNASWQDAPVDGLPELPKWPTGLGKPSAGSDALSESPQWPTGTDNDSTAKGSTPPRWQNWSEQSTGDWQNWSKNDSREDVTQEQSEADTVASQNRDVRANVDTGETGTMAESDRGMQNSNSWSSAAQQPAPQSSQEGTQDITTYQGMPAKGGAFKTPVWKGSGGALLQTGEGWSSGNSVTAEPTGGARVIPSWRGKGLAKGKTPLAGDPSSAPAVEGASPLTSKGLADNRSESFVEAKGGPSTTWEGFAMGEGPFGALGANTAAISNSISTGQDEGESSIRIRNLLAGDTVASSSSEVTGDSSMAWNMAWKGKGLAMGEALSGASSNNITDGNRFEDAAFAYKGKGYSAPSHAGWWSAVGGKASPTQNGDSSSHGDSNAFQAGFSMMSGKGKGCPQLDGGMESGMTDNKAAVDNPNQSGGENASQIGNLQKAFAAFLGKGKKARSQPMSDGNQETTNPSLEAFTPASLAMVASLGANAASTSPAAHQGDSPPQVNSFNASVLEKAAMLAQGSPEVQHLLRNLNTSQPQMQPSSSDVSATAEKTPSGPLTLPNNMQMQFPNMQQHSAQQYGQPVLPNSSTDDDQQQQAAQQQGRPPLQKATTEHDQQSPQDVMRKRIMQLQLLKMQAQMRGNPQQASTQPTQTVQTPEQQLQQQELLKKQLLQMQLMRMQAQAQPNQQFAAMQQNQPSSSAEQAPEQHDQDAMKKQVEIMRQKQRDMMQQQMMQMQQQEMQQQMMQQQHVLKMEVMKQQMLKEQEEMQKEMLKQQQVKQLANQMMQQQIMQQQLTQQQPEESQQQQQNMGPASDMKELESSLLKALGEACG